MANLTNRELRHLEDMHGFEVIDTALDCLPPSVSPFTDLISHMVKEGDLKNKNGVHPDKVLEVATALELARTSTFDAKGKRCKAAKGTGESVEGCYTRMAARVYHATPLSGGKSGKLVDDAYKVHSHGWHTICWSDWRNVYKSRFRECVLIPALEQEFDRNICYLTTFEIHGTNLTVESSTQKFSALREKKTVPLLCGGI